MLDIFVQLDFFRQLIQISVHAHTDIPTSFGAVKHLCMFSLPSPHHRGKQLYSGSLLQLHQLVYHLINALLAYLPAAARTMGDAHPGIQKSEIIINFGYRSHGRPGISVGGFLVDRDWRRKSFYFIYIRLFHLSQKLSGVGGKRFHISSLPLRINGIKSQRGFTRTRQSRENHKLISRNIYIQVFQVMFVGSPYFDIFSWPHTWNIYMLI